MEQKAPIGRDTLLWGLEFMGYYHLSAPSSVVCKISASVLGCNASEPS